ncbi:DUF4870 domain-containing protein [Herbiconiux sp. SYSU D00978]|uniref:DUF4870 domain-containing protein n=1 Tax=Herbiconiux sp. SYSU D00978 TaxID=2812562 RepID=UPI0027DE6C4F|nr:DUF4870 domain-containing protein [Herbiconiux sp. SYSU D00978]
MSSQYPGDPYQPGGSTPPPPPPGGQPYGQPYGQAAGAPLSAQEDRQWAMFSHLFSVIAYVITSGTLGWAPALVIYLIFKDRGRFTREQAKEALNFHITVVIAAIALVILTIVLTLVTFGLFGFVAPVLFVALGIYALVFGIIATVRANRGEAYRYPATIRFVK